MEPIYFRGPAELRAWLEANHETGGEVYVGAWKKGTGRPSLTWEEIVDEALCVGWIDGVRRPVDGDRWAIRLTPRRKGSNWSDRNIGRVEALRAEGRMRAAGEAAFAARREERPGVYSFEQRKELTLTPDEEARFRAETAAWAWFSGQAPSYRRTATFWVVSAKRPETRERRLATLIEDSAAGRDVKPIARNRRPGST
jgi:uncharacterized protein YdeI (YjbR/CyaY-like superfamily)